MKEVEKIKEVHETSQAIGSFIDWLASEKDLHLCKMHHHTEVCGPIGDTDCGLFDGQWLMEHYNMEQLLADYFKIDLKKAEEERMEILENIRNQNKEKPA